MYKLWLCISFNKRCFGIKKYFQKANFVLLGFYIELKSQNVILWRRVTVHV